MPPVPYVMMTVVCIIILSIFPAIADVAIAMRLS